MQTHNVNQKVNWGLPYVDQELYH